MSAAGEATRAPRSSSGTFWAFVPVGLLVVSTAGVGAMSAVAAHDSGFALERDYYQRAVHWDAQEAQWARNAELGYHVAVELPETSSGAALVANVTDRAGAALRGASVEVEAFANARSADRRALRLVEQPDGTYAVPLGSARPGLWEFRFTVAAGNGRFTAVDRADIPYRSPL